MNLEKLTTEVKAKRRAPGRFEVVPSEMYPAAIADLQVALEEDRAVAGALAMYKAQAARLGTEAWELALVPRDLVNGDDVVVRGEALELARLWFTEYLHQSIGHAPMELRILKDEDWRL